ncbi:hypothetical protein K435DRAFT_871664 [Dendrothele bispora CBS 962.96]|uniref:Uncharacterized protein n=1 Tax=Dendrothele bispora (strain CBS 962.96) TaxID=1314807 RepID=A0A4S8L3V2_DENBC|nr:hypothetical protein K435DRAFT_871664 [Dendrothele bispora CBS 962.96]
MQVAQDKDLFKLGLALYGCVIGTEFSIAVGVTFKESIHMLYLFVPKLFRPRGKAYQDISDVLDIKFLIMMQRVGDAAELARKMVD